jgi:hypothetical protein
MAEGAPSASSPRPERSIPPLALAVASQEAAAPPLATSVPSLEIATALQEVTTPSLAKAVPWRGVATRSPAVAAPSLATAAPSVEAAIPSLAIPFSSYVLAILSVEVGAPPLAMARPSSKAPSAPLVTTVSAPPMWPTIALATASMFADEPGHDAVIVTASATGTVLVVAACQQDADVVAPVAFVRRDTECGVRCDDGFLTGASLWLR